MGKIAGRRRRKNLRNNRLYNDSSYGFKILNVMKSD
jgi:hypothetical protein